MEKRSTVWVGLALIVVASLCLRCDGRALVVGHRGVPSWRLEETLAGWELAAALGADFIEADLCVTGDGHLICRHECELSVTTDVAEREEFSERYRARAEPHLRKKSTATDTGWYTEDFTLAEIRTLRTKEHLDDTVRTHAYDGLYGIATFDEYLQLASALTATRSRPPTVAAARDHLDGVPVGVYIETKTPTHFRSIGLPMEHLMLEALEVQGYKQRCSDAYDLYYPDDINTWIDVCGVILQSFEDNLKAQVWQSHPFYPVVQLLGAEDEKMRGSDLTYGELMTTESLAQLATWATGIGPAKSSVLNVTAVSVAGESPSTDDSECSGVSVEYGSTGLLERAHEANLLVHPYTFRKEEYYMACMFDNDMSLELDAFFALGVDGVFTDSVDTAVAARDRMFPDSGSYVATLIVCLYVITAATAVIYAILMAVSLSVWVRTKLRSSNTPVVITDHSDDLDIVNEG